MSEQIQPTGLFERFRRILQVEGQLYAKTLHWLRDHRSNNMTDAQVQHVVSLNRPISGQARICENCGWPASIGNLCMICCDMAEALMPQKGLMAAHEEWRRMRLARRMGLL